MKTVSVHCLVLMESRVETLNVKVQQCANSRPSEMSAGGCGWQSFDGSEVCILRHCGINSAALFPACPTGAEAEIAFHWSLLYNSCEELYKSQQWRGTWDRLCRGYGNTSMPESQVQALLNIHHHYRAAVMDFIDLQELPYRDVLKCNCAQKYQSIVADGICLGPRLRNQYIVMPCHPPMDEGTPIKHGSKHADRMLVRNGDLRKLLFKLSLVEGLTVQEHGELHALARQHCPEALAASLVHITAVTGQSCDYLVLENSVYRARDAVKAVKGAQPSAAQQLFHELGCNSPACAILRLKCCAGLQEWRQQVHESLQTKDVAPEPPQMLRTLAPNLKWVFKAVHRLVLQARDSPSPATSTSARSMCEALLVILEHLESVRSTCMHAVPTFHAHNAVQQYSRELHAAVQHR